MSTTKNIDGLPAIRLHGMPLAVVDSTGLIDFITTRMKAGTGGWLLTANLDILRRFVLFPEMRALYERADLAVADGMPLVWASRLQGTPLPERIAGSSLVMPLCKAAAAFQARVLLLGGEPQANAGTAIRLRNECPGLVICEGDAPMISAEPTAEQIAAASARIAAAKPDLVLVAMGSPKQEKVIDALRAQFPQIWWIGVGITFSFLSGHVQRAPRAFQVLGLEWVHRMVQEPKRLFHRYVIEDLPFAFRLFGRACIDRFRGSTA